MNRLFKLTIRLALVVLAIPASSYAQLTPSSSVVGFSFVEGQDRYRSGESLKLFYRLDFKKDWHGQSHNPLADGLIATTLEVTADEGIAIGRVVYPKGILEKFEFSHDLLSTYGGNTYIGVTGAIAPNVSAGEYTIRAKLTVQSCDDKSCLVPSNMELVTKITVVSAGESFTRKNTDIYDANDFLFFHGGGASDSSEIADYITSNGMLLTFLFIFLGGLALNLTPCVYPLIPVTVSYFGGKSEAKKGKLVLHALVYLLGMAAMYSSLGLFAALTGSLFGGILQSVWAIGAVVIVMVGLSLSMFGLYEIQPPAVLSQIGGKNREGFFGTFMMGLTVGIIAAPCIGPFVLGLLTFVGERGDPLLGFTMFFVLAIGLGLPFVALAIFSGGISALPKSGMWMVWVKKVFGFILLGMAIFVMEPVIPEEWYLPIFGIFFLVSGVYLGFISKVSGQGKSFYVAKYLVALLFIGLSMFAFMLAGGEEKKGIVWGTATDAAIAEAKANGKPVIIDFSADWCLPCKELEHFTFTDPNVMKSVENVETLLADITTSGNVEAEELKSRFKVIGVPTVVFLDKNGEERKDLTFVGFVDAEDFLKRVNSLLAN